MSNHLRKVFTLKGMLFSILMATLLLTGVGLIMMKFNEGFTALKWMFMGFVIASVLSFFLRRQFIRPIKPLVQGMQAVSKGNLDVQIEETTRAEMGILIASFNQMVQDLKRSQHALRETEERYRRIFENSKDMVYVTSAEGRYIDVNQAGVEMLGYETKEELFCVSAKDTYLHPEQRDAFRKEISKKGFIKDFEVKLKKKDGTLIDALITANVKKDATGQILGYEGIIKDISERKRMEEELVRSKEELQGLYDTSVLINQTLDLERILPLALEKALNFIGFEKGTVHLISKEGENLELASHKGFSSALIESVREMKLGEGVAGKAIQMKRPVILPIQEYPSSRLLPLLEEEGVQLTVGIPLLSKEKAIGALTLSTLSFRNITQREIHLLESIGNQIGLALENAQLFSNLEKAKSEWETTFDAVTDLITIRYKDYRFIRANQAAFKRFGLKPHQMVGKKCFEIFYQRHQPCDGCYLAQTFITKRPLSGERESRYLKGTFQYTTFPISNKDGEVMAVVDLAREITEEKQRQVEKEVISQINRILASSLDVKRVMKDIHLELKKVLDSEKMMITLFDERRGGFQYISLEKGDPKVWVEGGILPKEETASIKAIQAGEPLLGPDPGQGDFGLDQKWCEEGIRSSLVFPLASKGKVIGILNFGSKADNHFSDRHIHFLRSIVPGLSIFIQNALLFEETQKRLDELTILYEVMKISASSLNLDQMLREMIRCLNRFFKFETLGIALIDEKTKRIVVHSSFMGHPVEEIEKLELCLGKGITGWVAEKGEPLLVNDVHNDPRYIVYDENIQSEICIPLKVGPKVIGLIDAQSRKLNAFTEDDLRLLSIIGGQLAVLIENLRLYEEVKQSEEKYRVAVESALDGVCVIGEDYRIKYANQKLAEIQGYSLEEIIGTDFRNYLDQESRILLNDRYVQRHQGKRLSPRFELTILRKGGERRNVEVSARRIRDSKGVTNLISFLKDITEKKKMETQLLQAEKLRALAEMASGVAHDFNNALASILGNAQLLLYTVKEEEIQQPLRVIEKVAKDSAQTVRRLQNFTKKKEDQELYPVEVNVIIQDSIEMTKPKWKDEVQSRGLRIEIVSHFEKVPLVAAHPSELREVITNMIFNAIEAMPQGGKIEIRTFKKNQKVVIQISDTGVGIEEEVKSKIFEPFFTTKPFTNTGLGLAMSYGIIRRWGGEIEVQSQIGHGTTFTIVLPTGQMKNETKEFPQRIRTSKKAHILVIDDEEFVRCVLSRTLTQLQHQVTLAEDGEKGIQLFQDGKFDMVLTDLGMPGMSGWEVCRRIKKLSPYTPVGMITGWGIEIDRGQMEEFGLDFIVSKPFDFNQILNMVADTLTPREKELIS